ncbi:LOW QUALITY PROTEIN: PKD1 isoform 12, partial [Pan troglodytes]
AGVLVDSAVEVAFLWTFGDGEQALHQFQPPYNESFPVPDSVAQVLVEHNVTHTYAAPGEYVLTVLASNAFENLTQQVLIRSGRVPIVSLECVSCKAQAVYEVSRSSYVYLEGRCLNCSSGSKRGRWAARTFSNKTLVLDETTTSTGSAGMRLV